MTESAFDPGTLERVPVLGPSLAVLRGTGVYKGDYAHEWVRSQLKNLGVRTFGDLAIRDDSLPAEKRYKLVVTVADVTMGQLVRLPWDYRRVYGLDPDEQSVADAVRAVGGHPELGVEPVEGLFAGPLGGPVVVVVDPVVGVGLEGLGG